MNIGSIDLNLLVIFDAVWRLRSVSRAAEAVGLSQPAVSNALRRLRLQFHDKLFVRAAAGMLPTPAAQELGEAVSTALAQIDAGLKRRRAFDPASEARTFTIIMTDIGEIVFLPRLLDYCKRAAPGVSIRTVQPPSGAILPALKAGEVDLAVGFMPDLRAGVYQQRLFTTDYVCILRKDHPAIGGRLSRRQFASAIHAVAEATGTGHYVVERELARLGLERHIGLRVPHFLALPLIIAATDMVATVPQPLGAAFERIINIRLLPHPIKFPRLSIKQFWHERFHGDPGNRWLRQTCTSLFQGPAGPA